MRSLASLFKIALYLTFGLMAAAILVTLTLELRRSSVDVHLLEFELDMFKTVLAGFVVGMLGILIPALASETRERFTQRKESRIAYSKAKTGIDYLKLRLAAASLADSAAALREAHFYKHQAELFDDFPIWLRKRYGSKMTGDRWDEIMYGRLFCARQVLEENAELWDLLSPGQRIALLDRSLPTKSEIPADRLPCAP
ncbi:MAG TPA: hypothetical protein VGZ91_19975 [Candidatus Sulfotelmatobacter sp.]|jgi:hypothetical protein|nr:hypothetical protein [Candidatus Sulfotelmatobacter sp.]